MGTLDDKSHPPIHPVNYNFEIFDKLSPLEVQIYDLVSWQFLASLSKDAKAIQTDIILTVGNEEFSLKGLKITEQNWLEVANEKWAEVKVP